MKTLLTITALILLSSLANAQILPVDSQYEGHKSDLNQGGNSSGWTIPLEPFIVMQNLQDLRSYPHKLPAPETYYAHVTDMNQQPLIIGCTLPLVPLTEMHNLEKFGSNKFLNPKSDGETLMKLDSSVSEQDKQTYTYNSEGKLVERKWFSKDMDGNWKPNYRKQFSEEPNLLQEIYSQYNTSEEAWEYYNKNENIYNDSNLIIETNHYSWQPNLSIWLLDGQMEYIYDENGNNTEFTVHVWEGLTSYPYYQKESSYSDQHVLIQSIEKINNPEFNQLVNMRRIVKSVNAEGHIENSLTTLWNSETETWENRALSDFIYNNQGLVYSRENSVWQEQNNVFIRQSRTEYFYQNGTEIATEINSSWSQEFGEWVGLNKYDRVLDGFGNQESLNYSYWNSQISNWTPFFKTERIHDTSISSEDIILPVDFTETPSMLLQEDLYQYLGNNYELNASTQFYYTPLSIVSGINEHHDNIQVSIYPNPCREIINVGVVNTVPYTFELYDITGKRVIQQVETTSTQIGTTGLSSGIYIYRIHSNGLDITGKIIKE